MAVTLNNFWGAETGGLEETTSITGSTAASSTQARSGSYSYNIPSSSTLKLDVFDVIADAGGDYIVGFAFRPDLSSTTGTVLNITDAGGSCLRFGTWTVGGDQYTLDDANGATIEDSIQTIVDNEWVFVEIYFQHSATGNVEVFIDGVSILSGTSKDLIDSGSIVSLDFASPTIYVDDIYFMSGATAATDRLGGCEVFSYRSSKASAVPDDGGDNLTSGQWVDIQAIPLNTTTQATMDSDPQSGAVNTDDVGGSAGTGGPNTDANITGTVKAIKGIWKCLRAGGGATEQYGLLGNSVDGTHPIGDLDITTGHLNYFGIVTDQVYTFAGVDVALSGGGRGVEVSPDGLRLYIGIQTPSIRQYDLSPAWDIASATFDTAYNPAWASVLDMCWSDDGTDLYVCFYSEGVGETRVRQYTCTTAYDIGTASFTGEFNFIGDHTGSAGVYLGDSNTKLFLLDSTDSIHRYTLSSAKDITSVGSINHSSTVLIGRGLSFNAAGTRFATSGDGVLQFKVYETDTAWDVSTVREIQSANVFTASNLTGIAFGSNDGADKLFVTWDTSLVEEYELGGVIPTASQYAQIGMFVDGAQNLDIAAMLATVLHTPPVAAVSYPPLRIPNDYLPFLVR